MLPEIPVLDFSNSIKNNKGSIINDQTYNLTNIEISELEIELGFIKIKFLFKIYF